MSMKKAYLAIDAHASNSVLGCMNSKGAFLRHWRFPTSEQHFIGHIKQLKAERKILAIEEGPLAYWIAQTVRPYVTEIIISDPRETPLISRNAMKRDELDVKNLCRLLRLGELKQVYHPEEDHRAVFKAAVQQYLDLTKQEVAVKQKIKAKYRGWGVVEVEGSSVYNLDKKEKYLKSIKSSAVCNQLERLYELLSATLQLQHRALQEATQLSRRYPEIKEFKKMPGVGPVGAMVFDAYIHTPHRFKRKSQLWRYCRLAVTDRSSDGKPLGYKRLDRAGNHELKAMSFRTWAASMVTKNVNEVRQFYQQSLQRTHNHTAARLNTQRKIMSVLHGVWKKREVYRPELFRGFA